MSNILTANDILESNDIPIEKVEMPEWGGHVFVKGLTGTQRDRFEVMVLNWKEKDRNLENIRAQLVSWTTVDEKGNLIFEQSPLVVKQLGQKSSIALDRLFDKAQELSGVSQKDIEELEGN